MFTKAFPMVRVINGQRAGEFGKVIRYMPGNDRVMVKFGKAADYRAFKIENLQEITSR